ncbi:MAG: hypothetical protein QM831_35095 [Kofleriaceae bacterium]
MKKYLFLALLAACGGGDDGMQMCGADHCGLQGHTIVKWTFDKYPEWQFTGDGCGDFQAGKVRVDMQSNTDPTMVTVQTEDCGAAQITFDGLTESDNFTAFVDVQDFVGNSLLTGPVTMSPVTPGVYQMDSSVNVNIPYTSWAGASTFTGTFLFYLTWGGMPCSAATPTAVAYQTVALLDMAGNPIATTAMTSPNNEVLDGTTRVACFDKATQQFPMSVTSLPFGPVQIVVNGYADMASPAIYTATIPTFIGAGITNDTITYDIAPVM